MTDAEQVLADIVNGRTFGTWDNKGAAQAGLEVEQRRAAQKAVSATPSAR